MGGERVAFKMWEYSDRLIKVFRWWSSKRRAFHVCIFWYLLHARVSQINWIAFLSHLVELTSTSSPALYKKDKWEGVKPCYLSFIVPTVTSDVWILYRLLGACTLSRMLCSKLLVGFVIQCFPWSHIFQILPLRIFPPILKFHPHHSGQGTVLLLLVTAHLLATLMVWNLVFRSPGILSKPYELLAHII